MMRHPERLVTPAEPVCGGGIERIAVAFTQHIGGENQHDSQPNGGRGRRRRSERTRCANRLSNSDLKPAAAG